MAAKLHSPAKRGDVIRMLMACPRAAHVLRLMISDMAQLGRGVSWVLMADDRPLAAAGLWPAPSPAPDVAALANGRPVVVLWFLSVPAAADYLPMMVRHGRNEVRAIMAAGGVVVADIDPEHASGARLARLIGLAPRAHVGGHDLWSSPLT